MKAEKIEVDLVQRVRIIKSEGDTAYLPIPNDPETPLDEFTPQISHSQLRGLFQFDPRFNENCNNGTEIDVEIKIRGVSPGKAYSEATDDEKKATTRKRAGKAGEPSPDSDAPGVVE